jgi:two-component system OmpR family sensor kinase
MKQLPIRMRLTLAFALAMALVLAATGAVLYLRLGSSLDEAVDAGLEDRAAELVPRVRRDATELGESALADPDERLVQVLDGHGRIVDATPGMRQRPLLQADELARAESGDLKRLEREGLSRFAGEARILVTSVDGPDGPRILLVGASLEDRDETVRAFLIELLLVGPAALLLVSLLGYGLATAALRPVDSMRLEADAISASEPGRRLPLPSSHDEVRRLGETLNDMLDRLESALERERGFVADASHELRTPLTLLKTELELALRRPRTQAELEHALRSAADETDRLARLAEDLLVLARSDRGRLPLRRERVAARGLLLRVRDRFAARAAGAERTLVVEAPEDLELTADPLRLEQALGNLLENALRHGDGEIRLSAAARDGGVELHVLDEGSGFPPDFLPRAFDRFSRPDEARSGSGAGLGLTIVAAIAAAHGGSAHAANRAERGADAWLALPPDRPDAAG